MGHTIGGAERARSATTARSGKGRPRALLRLGALAVLALLGAACSTTPMPPPPIEYLDYRVGPPDELAITILPDPPIAETAIVRPDGMITVQLIGDVQAGGRTTTEIASDIESRISRFKRGAVVTVALASAQSAQITVLGEVRRPASFALTRQIRVSEAIGSVGDVTLFANSDDILVVRSAPSLEVIEVDIDAIRNGDLSTNVQLYGGDIVYVPPSMLARIGYAINMVLFPFQPLLGVATSAAGSFIAN